MDEKWNCGHESKSEISQKNLEKAAVHESSIEGDKIKKESHLLTNLQ